MVSMSLFSIYNLFTIGLLTLIRHVDVNSLFKDIHRNPQNYLNGTTPLDVLDFIHHCEAGAANCTDLPGDRDSFMFYDSLHPSEQVHRVVAQNFMDVINGGSRFATYW